MTLAVIQTGGKQYLVAKKDKIKVEKLAAKEGQEIIFKEVLMLAEKKGSEVKVGTPTLKSAKVTAKVLKQGKDKKVIGAHYKPKTRNKKIYGHRQPFTEVEIKEISS